MRSDELGSLALAIQTSRFESQNIELKAASRGCPTRLYDTLSSFSNQDQGGMIVFGIDESRDFEIVGVYDAQDLQKKVTEQCKQMEPPVRALFTACSVDGKTVVSAEIPGIDMADRPVFYKGAGRLRGSYIRIGESDEPMNEYEVYRYEAYRKRIRDDMRVIEDCHMDLFDQGLLAKFLEAVKRERTNLSHNVDDTEILELMGVTRQGRPTLAALMTFSRYPQAQFPQLCITTVALPGTRMGELGQDGERFIDNRRITGSIPDMLKESIDFVSKNSRTRSVIGSDGLRHDKDEYPIVAVREAILNALLHRDYSSHTENTPIAIEMYRDRLEIVSSGGLYGRTTIESLGTTRPETRNATLANILELLKITENRYSGIPTIRRECQEARLPEPLFASSRGEFRVTLRNNIYDATDPASKVRQQRTAQDLLAFCETPRSRSELLEFTGASRYITMEKLVQPLVDQGKLRLSIPEKPRSSKQRFVRT